MKVNQISLCLAASIVAFSQMHAGQMAEASMEAAQAPAEAAAAEWNLVQGVDTVGDEGRGDWFKKKKILQQARKLYQELQKAVHKVVEFQASEQAEQTPLIKELTERLDALGIEPESVQTQLQELITSIEALSEVPKLTELQRQTLVEQQDTKDLLQQFLQDVTFAYELKKGLHEALAIAENQVQHCQAYEKRAWALYEAIDAALNDSIAEQMFEEMQTMLENIGLIDSYLTKDLQGYFKKSLPLFQEQEQKISEAYSQLQDRGIFAKKASEEAAPEQKAVPVKAAPRSWWQIILSPFTWLWSWIMSFFRK